MHKKVGRGLKICGTLLAGSPFTLHKSASKLIQTGLAKTIAKPRDCKGNLFYTSMEIFTFLPLLFSEIRLDRWRRLGGQTLELTDLATVESSKARNAIKSVRRVCTQLESSISLDAPNTLDTLR